MKHSRGAVYTFSAVMMLALAVVIGMAVAIKIRARADLAFDSSSAIKMDRLLERAASDALDWIVSTVNSSGPLEARGHGTSVLERIEAVRADGRAYAISPDLEAIGASAFIADTSLDASLELPYAIPTFPQRIGERYYYFIRAEASVDEVMRRSLEMTVYLDVDGATGRVTDVRKFYSLPRTER